MADTKISDLTADASPSSDDLVVTVNDPSGSPVNRKVTLANLAAALASIGAYASDSELSDHLTDSSAAHAASAISIADAGNDFTATDVEGALAELQSDHEADAQALADHISDSSAAHAASAVSIADAGNDFTATDVEGALAELQSDHEADAQSLADHLSDTSAAHAASAVSYNGGTGMSATDVEAAIDELATEKANLSGATFTGDVVVPAEAYGPGWNGSNEAATKNDIYDELETFVELFADDPTEVDIAVDGAISLTALIARQTEITRLDAYLPIFGKTTGDLDITSTTPANVTDLAVALAASTTYEVTAHIGYDGPNTSNDFRLAWSIPSGATGQQTAWGLATAGSSFQAANQFEIRFASAWTTNRDFGAAGAGTNGSIRVHGYITTTNAGTLQATAAHSAGPDATPFTVLSGSFVTARKVA